MYYWFQNLNENRKQLFHFRGSVGRDWHRVWVKYEISSGPALKFEYQHGEAFDGDSGSMLILGLGFFTAYISFYLPDRLYFKRKCIATWDNNREFYLIDGRRYGFYFYHFDFVWNWHAKVHEFNSRDPWWMNFRFSFDNFFLGRPECLEDKLVSAENVRFKIGEKEFVMDSVEWTRRRRFRRHIPFSLWHQEWVSVSMKIDKPPMRAGKGENSWDIDDDGSFGLSMSWPHEKPTYRNLNEMKRLAIEEYVANTLRNAKRYGSGSGERGIKASDVFKYVG